MLGGEHRSTMYGTQHIVDLFLDYSPSFYLAREFLYACPLCERTTQLRAMFATFECARSFVHHLRSRSASKRYFLGEKETTGLHCLYPGYRRYRPTVRGWEVADKPNSSRTGLPYEFTSSVLNSCSTIIFDIENIRNFPFRDLRHRACARSIKNYRVLSRASILRYYSRFQIIRIIYSVLFRIVINNNIFSFSLGNINSVKIINSANKKIYLS